MGNIIKTKNGHCVKLRNGYCVTLNIQIPVTTFGCGQTYARIWRLDINIVDTTRKPDIRLISEL